MSQISLKILFAGVLTSLFGCSPGVMLPPVQEPLDSAAWRNCAQDAEQRAGRALIDDLNMDSHQLLCRGVVLANDESKVDEAVEMLTEAAVIDKKDHRAYYLSGRVLTQAGRYEEALTAFARSQKRYSPMEVPTVRLGNMVLEKSGENEAVNFLEKANKRDLCDFGCKGLLANLYHRTENTEQAVQLYEEMIEENSADPEAYVGLARINNSGNLFVEEAKFLNKAINSDGFDSLPKDKQASLLHSRAFSLYNSERYADAKKVLSKAMTYKTSAHWNLLAGWIEMKMKDPAMALIQFEKAIDEDPKLAPAHTGVGDAAKAMGRLDDAVNAYKQAAFLAPTDGVIKLKLAAIYIEQKDIGKAKIQLDDATKLGTDKLPKDLLQQITDALTKHDAGN